MHAGERIRKIRWRKHLSQKEVARRAKTSQTYLSRLEWGDYSMNLKMLHRIAKALGVEPQELIC